MNHHNHPNAPNDPNDPLDARDHRQLAQQLGLLHFQDEAPGMVFWHPRGWQLYRLLEAAARHQIEREGYAEVRTPQVLRQPIWEASGHWASFSGGMLELERPPERREALKPVSCPGHAQLVARRVVSYQELPLRLAEFGLVHRDERSGSLHGLLRLRQFTQDDGHIFCAEHQLVDEIAAFCRSLIAFYARFELEAPKVGLSLRPEARHGSDALWDQAEEALRQGAAQAGLAWHEQLGEGAFYGPKLEFVLLDSAGRPWQCGTIQVDFVMPERFDLSYMNAAGERQRPVMLHRALYGSLERFMGLLLEHHGRHLPAWLAPVQARVLPLSEAFAGYAGEVARALGDAGVRVEVDDRSESLGRRVAEALRDGVPVSVVVGERERQARSASVRLRSGSRVAPLAEAVREVVEACRAVA